VAYLWLYTLLLAGLLALSPGLTDRLQRGLERALRGWGLIAWPAAFLGVARLALEARWPQAPNLIHDWYGHAMFLAGFLFGFSSARSDAIWAGFMRWRTPALAGAVGAYSLIAVAAARMLVQAPTLGAATVARHAAPGHTLFDIVAAAVWAIDQWLWITAFLGFAYRHLRGRDGPARRYLTEAIFPFYIVHQTTIAVVGHYLAKAGLPLGLEAFLLITATVASCFLAFEGVRRLPWLRPVFGLKALERPPVRARAWSEASPEP